MSDGLTGQHVVKIARSWLGTPYLHQASNCGGGADCLGLLRGIWRELCGNEPEEIPAYTSDWSESQGEERLWIAAQRHLLPKPSDAPEPGDVLLFRMRDGFVAKHLGIQSTIGKGARFIHAYQGHGVVESALNAAWTRRIVARFSFPEEKI